MEWDDANPASALSSKSGASKLSKSNVGGKKSKQEKYEAIASPTPSMNPPGGALVAMDLAWLPRQGEIIEHTKLWGDCKVVELHQNFVFVEKLHRYGNSVKDNLLL